MTTASYLHMPINTPIVHLCWAEMNTLLALNTTDGAVQVRNADNLQQIDNNALINRVTAIATYNKHLAVATENGHIRLDDPSSNESIALIQFPHEAKQLDTTIQCLASYGEPHLFAGFANQLAVCSFLPDKHRFTFLGTTQLGQPIREIHPQSEHVALVTENMIESWKSTQASWEQQHTFAVQDATLTSGTYLPPTPGHFVAGTNKGTILQIDLEAEKYIEHFTDNTISQEEPLAHTEAVNKIAALAPQVFASGSNDGNAKIWDMRQSKRVNILRHPAAVTNLVTGENIVITAIQNNTTPPYLIRFDLRFPKDHQAP